MELDPMPLHIPCTSYTSPKEHSYLMNVIPLPGSTEITKSADEEELFGTKTQVQVKITRERAEPGERL